MRFKRPTVVQSLLMSHADFRTAASAKSWAKKHGFRHGKVDDSPSYWRLRQASPDAFQKGTLRTISFGNFGQTGIRAVIGVPRAGVRMNPTLLTLLPNPQEPEFASEAWTKFHSVEDDPVYADDAEFVHVPDVPGLPGTVWALGFFEGVEVVDDEGRSVSLMEDFTIEDGPWLVSSPSDKRSLWIVARNASSLRRIAKADGHDVTAVMYFPNDTSAKHDASRGYRHAFGDGGTLPKKRWHEAWPVLEKINDRAYELVAPHRVGFTVEPEGVVG